MEEDRLKEITEQWKLKADRDLKLVEKELNTEEPLTDILCFHCQQAVEKYLKTYLISQCVKPPKTHDIAILLEECKKHDLAFSSLSDVSYLTAYSVEIRYPDDFYIPEKSELFEAYKKAIRVKEFVLMRIKE